MVSESASTECDVYWELQFQFLHLQLQDFNTFTNPQTFKIVTLDP